MKLSTASVGMQMDRFCVCVYNNAYTPIDIMDRSDACGMYGTRIMLINAVDCQSKYRVEYSSMYRDCETELPYPFFV